MASDPRRRNILLTSQDAMEEEDEDVLFNQDPQVPTSSMPMPDGTGGAVTSAASTAATTRRELISTIITPSPFPHHTTGPTSSRFRNAYTRITTNPESDVEAWQALMTEVANCYKSIQSEIHSVDAEVQLQLDWIESCYGTLLKYFPYSNTHIQAIAEILLAQSAFPGEDGMNAGASMGLVVDRQRQQNCQAKLEYIFQRTLGFHMDGTPATAPAEGSEAETGPLSHPSLGGMCSASVELWVLYIEARQRQARRESAHLPDASKQIKEGTNRAYELALDHAGFAFSNHVLWKNYLQFAKSIHPSATAGANSGHLHDPQQMIALRNIYQRLICHPMTGLDQLWQEYEAFERQQSKALAEALLSEYTPKYQHARTVYLERHRVFNVEDLQTSRLATPPNLEELSEEHTTLQLWKTRVAYERTNPERLNPTDLQLRVRTAYKEMMCVWTQHPEVWHMWSQWEESIAQTGEPGVDRAVDVLDLAQTHIPDCTLLAYANAQLVELHATTVTQQPTKDEQDVAVLKPKHPSDCLPILEAFLERAPNTLGYALYQQMVRRHKGKDAARAVFAKARRILVVPETPTTGTSGEGGTADDPAAGATTATEEPGAAAGEAEEANDHKENETSNKRRMITNRLDASIGTAETATMTKSSSGAVSENPDAPGSAVRPGPITWHLYASHATIEHRINRSPETAARVYELGLRKHASFLSQPAYVLRYANILLELQDTVNLRALLTRALAACNQDKGNQSAAVAALWDMTLHFESLVSIGDASNLATTMAVERKRRAALVGPAVEDVATGFRVGMGDSVAIGAQKSTIAEQLNRQDGYDISSIIVNGLNRSVDALDIMGLWGSGVGVGSSLLGASSSQLSDDENAVIPGGKSDMAYQRRLRFAKLAALGGSGADAAGGDAGSRLMAARERFQTTSSAAPASQNTAITMVIQNSPEWLRNLLMMLPASRLRTPVLSKPPLQLTEMALVALRQNKLPAERPQDDKKAAGNKRKIGGGDGDSSDEEGGLRGGGGYGTQFRARQRARQMAGQANGTQEP